MTTPPVAVRALLAALILAAVLAIAGCSGGGSASPEATGIGDAEAYAAAAAALAPKSVATTDSPALFDPRGLVGSTIARDVASVVASLPAELAKGAEASITAASEGLPEGGVYVAITAKDQGEGEFGREAAWVYYVSGTPGAARADLVLSVSVPTNRPRAKFPQGWDAVDPAQLMSESPTATLEQTSVSTVDEAAEALLGPKSEQLATARDEISANSAGLPPLGYYRVDRQGTAGRVWWIYWDGTAWRAWPVASKS